MDPELKRKIPSGERILYTSHCAIAKKARREGGNTFGQLAITNKAMVFVAKKVGMGTRIGAMGGNVGYIPFREITELKNNKNKIFVKFPDPEDLSGKQEIGYTIEVERCKSVGEEPENFQKRKNSFGDFVENARFGVY